MTAPAPRPLRPLDPLQLDLATIVVRLEQAREQLESSGQVSEWLLDRILTCDLPRLRRHLDPNTLTVLADLQPGRGTP